MKNKILFILSSFTLLQHISIFPEMVVYECFNSLFKVEPVPTEYAACTLLKANPLPQDISYFAVPWTIVLKQKKLSSLPHLKLDNGFTICQHFRYEDIIPILKRMGIDTLFTPHVKKSKQYKDITVLPFPHYPKNGTIPAEKKDILYSFVGAESNQTVRRAIFKLPKKSDVIIIKRQSWSARTTQKKENKEYRNILSRSRFALCPRGHGASTIRFWEALQAGAIPILLADEMVLPPEINWSQCIIQIPEKDIHDVDKIIRSISKEQEENMRNNCLAAFKLFTGENLVRTIRCYYNSLSTN